MTDGRNDRQAKSKIAPLFQKRGYKLGDNCIQNFHLGRYIVGYTVGNLVLRRRSTYIANL